MLGYVELVPHAVISDWGQFDMVALLNEDRIGRGEYCGQQINSLGLHLGIFCHVIVT